MKLFNHEKDLILKITNLILLIWLITSITLLYTTVVDSIMTKPLQTYEKYKVSNCYYEATDMNTSDKNCQTAYESYQEYQKDQQYQNYRNMYSLIGSNAIVTVALNLLNRKDKKGVDKK